MQFKNFIDLIAEVAAKRIAKESEAKAETPDGVAIPRDSGINMEPRSYFFLIFVVFEQAGYPGTDCISLNATFA